MLLDSSKADTIVYVYACMHECIYVQLSLKLSEESLYRVSFSQNHFITPSHHQYLIQHSFLLKNTHFDSTSSFNLIQGFASGSQIGHL